MRNYRNKIWHLTQEARWQTHRGNRGTPHVAACTMAVRGPYNQKANTAKSHTLLPDKTGVFAQCFTDTSKSTQL